MPVLKKSDKKVTVVPEQAIDVGEFKVGLAGYDDKAGVIVVNFGNKKITADTAAKLRQVFDELHTLLRRKGPAESEV